MKQILLVAFALFLSVVTYSQTVLENLKAGYSTAWNVKIEKIELRDTATVLSFLTKSPQGSWISIPKETYIQPAGAKEKLFVTSADGIPMNAQYTMPASGEVRYKLTFPKIDPSVAKLDFGEANTGGTWFIYDIQLKPELFKSMLPEKMIGNWFRSDNAQWEISLFDSVAVYKSQVWKYIQYSKSKKTGKISLKSGDKNLIIYTKQVNDSTCLIGEDAAKLTRYSNQPNESVIAADNEPFKLPVFKTDTVTYCGYIKGFDRRAPQKTGMISVNDVLAGGQASFLLKINDDGTFKVKFPYINPQIVLVRLPFSNESVFMVPGKSIFQLIDRGNIKTPALFMGDFARVNSDLRKLTNIKGLDYFQMLDKILDFSPEQYKSWCQDQLKKDLAVVDELALKHSLCAKAVQLKKMELTYRYTSSIMEYGWNVESAYRKKNNIPQTQREIPFKAAKPDSTYYSFLTNDLVNNPLALLTFDYYFFINRIMFHESLRGTSSQYFVPEIADAMVKDGYKLTPEESDLVSKMKAVYTPEFKKIKEEFLQKYGTQFSRFYQKYSDKIQNLFKEKRGSSVTLAMVTEYLQGQNVVFTDDEKALLSADKQFGENPLTKNINSFQEKYNTQISQFYSNHQAFINEMSVIGRIAERNEKFQKILGIQPGLATDIMTSQDICRPIASEMTPVSDEKIKAYQKQITTPFIADYIALKNQESKAKVEANKKLTGARVNEVPKSDSDKLFDAIMEKYKGKVVYVDFWATWCSPCRSGIEQIKPLKDEMENENVAFVYITNQTSPKATYDNMIPAIKGEHYRVSADEWNILCSKFKISGIPHYVLVGKDGNVINPQLGHMENEQLKTLLMKYIKE